jgi:hypothetical protein
MACPHLVAVTTENEDLPDFACLTARDVIRSPLIHHRIALNLRHFLDPFKGKGRLFIRVERLPQQTSLSAGQRSGDGSWSLASDEIDGVHYLIPSYTARNHQLTIRVMALEAGAATTLKVADYSISVDGSPSLSPRGDVCDEDLSYKDPLMQGQLASVQSLFAKRESEVLELRESLQRERAARAAEGAQMRSTLEAEYGAQKQSLEANHHCELEAVRRLLQSEIQQLATRLNTSERELFAAKKLSADLLSKRAVDTDESARTRDEIQSARNSLEQELHRRVAEARRDASAHAEKAMQSARENWTRETAQSISRERQQVMHEGQLRIAQISKELKRDNEVLVKTEQNKVAKLEAKLAELRIRLLHTPLTTPSSPNSAPLDELVAMNSLLKDRETEIEGLQRQLDDQIQLSRKEFDTALRTERAFWQSQEASRRQKLVAELQRDAEAKVSALAFRCQQAEASLAQASLTNSNASAVRATPPLEPQRPSRPASTPIIRNLKPEQDGASGSPKGGLVKEFIFVVCCITPLLLFYLYLPSLKTYVGAITPAPPVSSAATLAPPVSHPEAATLHMVTVIHAANVRRAPSINSSVVFVLKRGAQVTIISKGARWSQVQAVGSMKESPSGWIANGYLSKE